jgi:hypothetical protein
VVALYRVPALEDDLMTTDRRMMVDDNVIRTADERVMRTYHVERVEVD